MTRHSSDPTAAPRPPPPPRWGVPRGPQERGQEHARTGPEALPPVRVSLPIRPLSVSGPVPGQPGLLSETPKSCISAVSKNAKSSGSGEVLSLTCTGKPRGMTRTFQARREGRNEPAGPTAHPREAQEQRFAPRDEAGAPCVPDCMPRRAESRRKSRPPERTRPDCLDVESSQAPRHADRPLTRPCSVDRWEG